MTNSSLLQVSQPSHRMGSHNYIPASATASSANGKYRTVSIFGGILDLADPTDGDGDSISSDGFSDDWSVEEEVQPQRKPRKAKPLRQAPTERIEFKSEQARDDEVHSELKSDAQQQDEPIEKSEVRAEDKEHNDRYREQEKSSEPPVKKILTSKVTESVPATTTTETTNLLQDANGFEQDAASEIDESVVTPDDIPKSIDLSLFLDKSLEERRQLQRCFLNELFFLPVS
ncbi:unnamed protein product [Cylindrotheca closterium]|nr:unnamed protein product [Cylindrotheca closterium]